MRDLTATLNRGELAAALEVFDPYAVVRFDPQWPESRPRFGIEDVRSWFEDLISTFGTGDLVIEELIEAGDRVLGRFRGHFKGRGSGVQDEIVIAQLLTFRRGKVIEFEYFLDFDEALAAIGLSD